MRKLVLDASIALKWFFQEKNSNLAGIFLKQIKKDEIKVFVPQIFFFELANAVKTKAKSTPEDVLGVINKIFSLKLNSEKINRKLLTKANFYAQKYDLTIYDASYLALARILRINLITADEKLKGKTKLKLIKILR